MKPIRNLIVIAGALCIAMLAFAQEQRRPMSPAGVASTQVGG
jgi:hypothetical protein